MRKVAALLLVSFTMLVVVDGAAASYYMTYGQAMKESRRWVKKRCGKERPGCLRGNSESCYPAERRAHNYVCSVIRFYIDRPEPGTESKCKAGLDWGISRSGYIKLNMAHRQNCEVIGTSAAAEELALRKATRKRRACYWGRRGRIFGREHVSCSRAKKVLSAYLNAGNSGTPGHWYCSHNSDNCYEGRKYFEFYVPGV